MRLDRGAISPHVVEEHGGTDGDYGHTVLRGGILNLTPLRSEKATAAFGNNYREDDPMFGTGGLGFGQEFKCGSYPRLGCWRATGRDADEPVRTFEHGGITGLKDFGRRTFGGKLFTQLGRVAGSDAHGAVFSRVVERFDGGEADIPTVLDEDSGGGGGGGGG